MPRIEFNEDEQKALCESRMRDGVLAAVGAGGYLLGLNTMQDCMRDEDVRPFLGHTLLHEIMPNIPAQKNEMEAYAARICGEWESPAEPQPLLSLCAFSVRKWLLSVLPTLKAYTDREFTIPPCLAFGLSALILFYAGVKPDADGEYFGLREEEKYRVEDEEAVLFAFSRLSRDMAPESLSYAVLADQEVWGEDLRQIEGLEDTVTNQLRDMQLLGVRATMAKAWQGYAE